jgi:hypothetical protein
VPLVQTSTADVVPAIRGHAGRGSRGAALVVLAVCALLAAAGGALGILVVVRGDPASRPIAARVPPVAGAWTARCGFGPVAVERIERIRGPVHGAGHAEPGGRTDQIRVSVTALNRLGRTIPYSPGQFRLRAEETGTTTSATNPNPPPASIAAGEKVRQRLTFVVPAARARFSVVFDDLSGAAPVQIALGSLPGQKEG